MFNHVEQWIKSIVIITDMTIIVYNIYFKNKTCRLQNLKTEITHFRLHKQIIKDKGETRVLRHVGGGGGAFAFFAPQKSMVDVEPDQ